MTGRKDTSANPDQRAARLKAALQANIHRRKAQARARADVVTATDSPQTGQGQGQAGQRQAQAGPGSARDARPQRKEQD